MPKYVLFAGVNGAGKSTMFHINSEFKDIPRINNDEILRSFGGDWRNKDDEKKAALLAVSKEKDLLDNRQSYNKETTLAGKSALFNIKMVKDMGYVVDLRYVGVDSPETAITRIQKRVSEGGHGIPEDKVRRRYYKSLENLAKVIPYCDSVIVYDNTLLYKTVAIFEKDKVPVISKDAPDWFVNVLADIKSKSDINPLGII